MEVAGFRKSNADLLLRKNSEEIITLSCSDCDKKLAGLTKINGDNNDAEFTAILTHADILWSTGDKHFIRFCHKGAYVYAELPKDSYNVSYASGHNRAIESMPCLKTGEEESRPGSRPIDPPSDVPKPDDRPKPGNDTSKPLVDTPAADKQPTIVINNYNVPVQAISGPMPQQLKPKPPAKNPPKRSINQCADASPHH